VAGAERESVSRIDRDADAYRADQGLSTKFMAAGMVVRSKDMVSSDAARE